MVQRRSFCHAMGLLLYDIAWLIGFCIVFAVLQVLTFCMLGGIMYTIFRVFSLPIKSFQEMMVYGWGTVFIGTITVGVVCMLVKTYEGHARGY